MQMKTRDKLLLMHLALTACFALHYGLIGAWSGMALNIISSIRNVTYYLLGKKGDVMALEVNMRPCGGFTPDMINFAHSTNVYKIWADMIAYDSTLMTAGDHQFCQDKMPTVPMTTANKMPQPGFTSPFLPSR